MGKASKDTTEVTSCVYHIPCDCFTHHSTACSYSSKQKQQDFSLSFISSTSPTAPGRAVLHVADASSMGHLLISSLNLFIAKLLPFSLLSTRIFSSSELICTPRCECKGVRNPYQLLSSHAGQATS